MQFSISRNSLCSSPIRLYSRFALRIQPFLRAPFLMLYRQINHSSSSLIIDRFACSLFSSFSATAHPSLPYKRSVEWCHLSGRFASHVVSRIRSQGRSRHFLSSDLCGATFATFCFTLPVYRIKFLFVRTMDYSLFCYVFSFHL